jgi:hypothetical protein
LSKVEKKIREDLEIEGYEPDTPKFEFLLLERKVEYCQVRQRVPRCPACKYYDYCPLVRDYLNALHGHQQINADKVVEPGDPEKT